MIDFNSILRDLSADVGVIDLKKKSHVSKLYNIIEQKTGDYDISREIVSNLINGIDTKKDAEEIQEIIIGLGKILSEASIFDDKYAFGTKFLSLTGTGQLFAKGLPAGEKIPKGPFMKVSETDKVVEVRVGGNITVYVEAEDTKKTYKITASKNAFQSMFGKMKKGADANAINWKDTTLETAACLGLYIDGNKMLSDLIAAKEQDDLPNVITSLKSLVSSALSNGQNYAAASGISSKLNTMPLSDWLLIGGLAAGMTKFKEAAVKFNPNIIHKDIGQYYAATERSDLIDGVKPNTADVIVASVPSKELIDAIKTDPVEYNKDGVCLIKSKGIKFIQVSLKKGEGKAQLGKIYSYIKDKYHLMSNDDILKMAISEGLVNEGLKSFFDKGMDFIKGIGSAFLEKLASVGKYIGSVANSIRSGLNSKGASKEVSKLGAQLKKAGLKGKISETVLREKKETMYDSFGQISQDPNLLKVLITNVNTKLSELQKSAASNPGFYYAGVSALSVPKSATVDDVGKLISNFQTTIVLKKLVDKTKKSTTELYKRMVEVEKEMIYGKTSLPIYKVYGLDIKGGGKAYEKYPGSETFIEDKLGLDTSDTVILYLQCNASGNYLTMNSYGLAGLDSKSGSLLYSKYRMGTNASGRYSYNFEGTQEVAIDKVKKSLGI